VNYLLRALVIAYVSVLSGCVDERGMQVTEAWSRATPPNMRIGVVYLNIHNRTEQDDALLSVTTSHAATVELHAVKTTDGLASMQRQTTWPVAAGATATLEPGGLHFMLMGMERPLVAGERFPLTLHFAKSSPVTVVVHVRGND